MTEQSPAATTSAGTDAAPEAGSRTGADAGAAGSFQYKYPNPLDGAPRLQWDAPVRKAPRRSPFAVPLLLVAFAVLGIAARLFAIFASARQLSVIGHILGGAAVSLIDAKSADHIMNVATGLAIVAFFAFIFTLMALRKRQRRGDRLAVAIGAHSAVRLSRRLYVGVVVLTVVLRSVLMQNYRASAEDRLRALQKLDYASIAINVAVVAFLAVVAVVASREIRRAKVAPASP
jgi:preprotein translocase subunit SecG